MGRFSIEVSSTHEFIIQSIRFTNCGRQSHLLQVDRCSKNTSILISQIVFFQTEGCSLVLHCAAPVSLNLHKSIFESGGGSNLNYSIYIHSSQVNFTLSETSFINNRAGSIYFSNGAVNIDSCLFVNNTSTTIGECYLLNDSTEITINRSRLINNGNTAIAVVQSAQWASLVVKNSVFARNKGLRGGVICLLHSFRIFITNSNFTSNQAKNGGVIFVGTKHNEWIISSSIAIVSCTFVENRALGGLGGVLCIINSEMLSVILNDTLYSSNQGLIGGAMCIINITTFKLTMLKMKFIKNTAIIGGGVMYASNMKDFIERGVFINNYAATDGGALFLNKIDSVAMYNCNFQYNFAIRTGGALKIWHKNFEYTTIKLSECTFGFNKATIKGGGIDSMRTKLSASSCNFFGHFAFIGGAISARESTLFLNNYSSYNNSAIVIGGSIASWSSIIEFTGNSSFDSDSAVLGGAIHIEDTINDCRYTDCLISWDKNSRINFTNTFATKGGSMIYGGMMDRCNEIQNENSLSSLSFNNMPYNVLSHGITSQPVQICQCENSTINCELRSDNRVVTPGKTFYIEVTCLDQMKQTVPCSVRGERCSSGTRSEFEVHQWQHHSFI